MRWFAASAMLWSETNWAIPFRNMTLSCARVWVLMCFVSDAVLYNKRKDASSAQVVVTLQLT